MFIKSRNLFLFLSLILLSGCGGGIFDPKGVIAVAQKNLIITSIVIMLIVIIPVLLLTFYTAYKYREGNKNAEYSPEWDHNLKLELIWWGIPIMIIIALSIITWKTSHSLDPYKEIHIENEQPIKIQVVSLNWKWLFIYPEQGIATINYIKAPKNVPIAFELTSDAPMNSFWIPQIAGMIYTMPGMQTKLHIVVNENGIYEGMSSNYSGDGFAGMTFKLDAVSKEDFAKWVKEAQNSNKILNTQEYLKLVKFSTNNPVVIYKNADAKLFNDIMMKYMAPQKSNLLIDVMAESKKTVIFDKDNKKEINN
jgi:cytochrome o ubiquinol oxidase subunit 2